MAKHHLACGPSRTVPRWSACFNHAMTNVVLRVCHESTIDALCVGCTYQCVAPARLELRFLYKSEMPFAPQSHLNLRILAAHNLACMALAWTITLQRGM